VAFTIAILGDHSAWLLAMGSWLMHIWFHDAGYTSRFFLQLGIRIRLSNVAELSQHGNWMVSISYFCFPGMTLDMTLGVSHQADSILGFQQTCMSRFVELQHHLQTSGVAQHNPNQLKDPQKRSKF